MAATQTARGMMHPVILVTILASASSITYEQCVARTPNKTRVVTNRHCYYLIGAMTYDQAASTAHCRDDSSKASVAVLNSDILLHRFMKWMETEMFPDKEHATLYVNLRQPAGVSGNTGWYWLLRDGTQVSPGKLTWATGQPDGGGGKVAVLMRDGLHDGDGGNRVLSTICQVPKPKPCGRFLAHYNIALKAGKEILSVTDAPTLPECRRKCLAYSGCVAFETQPHPGAGGCRLSGTKPDEDNGDIYEPSTAVDKAVYQIENE